MIMQALVEYYDALAARGKLSVAGWAMGKVSYALRLDEKGQLVGVVPLKRVPEGGKKEIPTVLSVPEPVKRTVAIQPNFLFDNSAYFLGVSDKEDKKGKARAAQCFEKARKYHQEVLKTLQSPAAKEVRSFFEGWDVEAAGENELLKPYIEDMKKGANLIFETSSGIYAQEDAEIRKTWENSKDTPSGDEGLGRCLVTGERTKIARLHPSVKGVAGAQSSGAALVSFNAPAFESYGHELRDATGQGLNAPVGELAAFKYTTVLNYMLADRTYTQRIADTTVVFWAEDAEPLYQDFFSCGLFGEDSSAVTTNDLEEVVKKLRTAGEVNFKGIPLKSSNRFYVLGIAPNAARLSIRFFCQDSFGAMLEHLREHQENLAICRPAYDTAAPLDLWNLLNETANQNARTKMPPSPMAGAVFRSILMGYEYPVALFQNVLLRIRTELDINWRKAAILKAFLLRTKYNDTYKEVLTVELNERSESTPYVLGRLFAVLEKLQMDANPGIKATIRDRYFASASTNPANVFPIVLRLSQHHVKKLPSEGAKIHYDRMIGELMGRIQESLPTRLSLQDQGVFYLGYYHQRQAFFKGKKEEEQ